MLCTFNTLKNITFDQKYKDHLLRFGQELNERSENA